MTAEEYSKLSEEDKLRVLLALRSDQMGITPDQHAADLRVSTEALTNFMRGQAISAADKKRIYDSCYEINAEMDELNQKQPQW
ncbi:MAG TPA: hypothetical protein VM912_21075 [Terriglobales bacterium]|nr:hypothetical protein [Terriglobales bacterium]